jgi:hydroxymethylbilane synthase
MRSPRAAEIAVHSMKDVPAELPRASCSRRSSSATIRATLSSRALRVLADLPAGALVGTSSLRRQAQIAARHPALEIRPLRGNVETRVAKLDRGEYAAIVLAAAGLKRLGLAARIRASLSIEESLPPAGQAALGIECLSARAEVCALIAPLQDPAASACVRAERAVNRALGGSCTIPLGAYAQATGSRLHLRALVAAPDGKRVARAEGEGAAERPEELGLRIADLLRERGATEILAALGA